MSPQLVLVGKGEVPRSASPGRAGAPPIPPGHVQLYCADPPRNLVLPLGPEPVKLGGGDTGWEVVGRPHQTGMTIWSGGEPYTLQLSLMLDNFARGTEVERSMRALHRLAHGDEDAEPGVLEVGGIPLPADEWVIDSLDYGDPIRRVDDMALLRQPLTLTLREYVPPEYVQLRRRALAKPKPKTRLVKVKKGDTPAKIARRLKLKSWKSLRELNPGIVKSANQKAKLHRKGGKFYVGRKIRAPIRRRPPRRGHGHGGTHGNHGLSGGN